MDRKGVLKRELVAALKSELAAAVLAHKTTVAGVTHAEAKPENDKDTRALEQSYLARGQAQRVEALRTAVLEVEAMDVQVSDGAKVVLGSLVTVTDDENERAYFVASQGGGVKLEAGSVQVVTPPSPLGRALIGKRVGDECEVTLAGKIRSLTVTRLD
jgi:transcription elongation GreA/GreB family factor